VQAVVLPGRHRRPAISPMTQLGGPVACPSLPPWRTSHDEPSCLIAPPVKTHPQRPVKALARPLEPEQRGSDHHSDPLLASRSDASDAFAFLLSGEKGS
jgi:hypothetical protein